MTSPATEMDTTTPSESGAIPPMTDAKADDDGDCVYNVPDQDKPKEYMLFLAQHAISNRMWSENDADRLCKFAVHCGEEWVTIHSMWVATVHELLLKYTRKQFIEDRREREV